MHIKPTTLAKLKLAKEWAMDVVNPDSKPEMLAHFRDAAWAQIDLIDNRDGSDEMPSDEAMSLLVDWTFWVVALNVELAELTK